MTWSVYAGIPSPAAFNAFTGHFGVRLGVLVSELRSFYSAGDVPMSQLGTG